MRTLIIALMIVLTGCSLTPTQKKWAGFAAGVLVVGAIAVHDTDNGKAPGASAEFGKGLPCRPQSDGSCR